MLFKKLPILIQLISILLVIMVVPTTIIVYYSTVSLTKYSENEIAEGVLSQLKSNSQLNERELFNLVQNVLTVVESSDVANMKGIDSYAVLNSNYNNISKGLKLSSHLRAIDDNSTLIQSMTFIPEDWDYVVASDKGIIRKEDYSNLEWLQGANEQMKGVVGYWYPRMEGTTPVITYLYRLNRLTTSVKGFIVVNLYESKVCDILNYGTYKTDSEAFLIDQKGMMISDKDKEFLFQDSTKLPYVKEMLEKEESEGYFYLEVDGQRLLCAYLKMSSRNWIYGVTYPMKDLLLGVDQIRRTEMILMAITMVFSGAIIIIYAMRFSRPMRKLADELNKKNGSLQKPNGNEITWLISAFENVEKQEEQLYETLRSKEKDTKNNILHNLLVGEIDTEEEKMELSKIFPYKLFLVAVITIDGRKEYLEKLNTKSRSYQRYLLMEIIAKKFPLGYVVHATRYDGGSIAVVMNMEDYDQVQSPKKLVAIFKEIQKSAQEIFEHTVSVGISGLHSNFEGVHECIFEAMEAVKGKMIHGAGTILFWKAKEEDKEKQHYYFPYERNEKIINYLNVGDLQGIQEELNALEQEILHQKAQLDEENIKMIFNQLASIAVKFMVEKNINIVKALGKQSDIYATIASVETMEELKNKLMDYFNRLINYINQENENDVLEGNHKERIVAYLQQHYKEDLVYEEVAKEMGISYSYMRRIIKEETGKSLNDYINKIRIEEVKKLLLGTGMSLSEIAPQVGYHNVQSVIRYFRKYEGITPKEFKESSH